MLYHCCGFDHCHESHRSSGQACLTEQRGILSVLRVNSEPHLTPNRPNSQHSCTSILLWLAYYCMLQRSRCIAVTTCCCQPKLLITELVPIANISAVFFEPIRSHTVFGLLEKCLSPHGHRMFYIYECVWLPLHEHHYLPCTSSSAHCMVLHWVLQGTAVSSLSSYLLFVIQQRVHKCVQTTADYNICSPGFVLY